MLMKDDAGQRLLMFPSLKDEAAKLHLEMDKELEEKKEQPAPEVNGNDEP